MDPKHSIPMLIAGVTALMVFFYVVSLHKRIEQRELKDVLVTTMENEIIKESSKRAAIRVVIADKLQKLQPKLDPIIANMIARAIDNSTTIYEIEPELIMAVMFTESSVNPMAESSARCIGLMQINYDVWKDEFDLPDYYGTFNIFINVDVGCRILKQYRTNSHDWTQALDKYSGGAKGYSDKVYKLRTKLVVME